MQQTLPNCLEQALNYLRKGLSIIPLRERGKEPLVPWAEFQKRKPTESEVKDWFERWPNANIGIVTGEISGIDVIDFDSPEAFAEAQQNYKVSDSPLAKTGRGYHLLCKHKTGTRNFQKKANLPGIDLRGDGGYVVASPSVHENGNSYHWCAGKSLDDVKLADLPEWILANSEDEKVPIKDIYDGVTEGSRNDSLTRIAGSLINDGLCFEECLEVVNAVNAKNKPPLPGIEVETIVKSIFEIHHKKELNSPTDNLLILPPLSLPEFLKKDIPPVEYYVQDIIQKKGKAMVSAAPNIGKSILVQNLALDIASGSEQFMGKFDVKPAKVLYLDLEMGESALWERFKKMSGFRTGSFENLYVKYIPALDLLNDESKKLIEGWLETLEVDVLILDPLGNAWSGDESNQEQVGKLIAYLNTLIAKFSISILVVHHWRKATRDFKTGGQMAAGSYRWEAWLDTHITLEGSFSSVTISCHKNRNRQKFSPFIAKINPESFCFEFITDFVKKFDDRTLVQLFEHFQQDRVSVPVLIKYAKDQKICSETTLRGLIEESKIILVDKSSKTHHLYKAASQVSLFSPVQENHKEDLL